MSQWNAVLGGRASALALYSTVQCEKTSCSTIFESNSVLQLYLESVLYTFYLYIISTFRYFDCLLHGLVTFILYGLLPLSQRYKLDVGMKLIRPFIILTSIAPSICGWSSAPAVTPRLHLTFSDWSR